jgi:hypothetical protein
MTMAKVDAEAALVPVVVAAPPDWRKPGPPRYRDRRE